jgi:predicted ribosome quality control (RQC) complex YloA/Tae2 family protein
MGTSYSLSGVSLHATEAALQVEWLDGLLRGAILQEVRAAVADTVVLKFRRPGETVRVLISVAAGRTRIHTVARAPLGRPRPIAFQGLLRKELRGRVGAIELVGDDRIVRIRVGPDRSLVALLMDARRDLLLVDGQDLVLGSALGTFARGARFLPPEARGTSPPDRFAGLVGRERDAAISEHFDRLAVQQRAAALRGRLRSRLKSVRRTVSKRRTEAGRAADAESLQQTGDLLQASFHTLKRGLSRVELEDYYVGGTRTIELDPALTPQDNVQRWYRKARKARRAGENATRRLEDAERELKALEEAEGALSDGDLDAVEALLPAARARQLRRTSLASRLPYRTFRAPDGTEVRIGRSARDNDLLTFRHSRGRDVWMHVRGRTGAHVVLRTSTPTPELLLLGAQAAAHHSGIEQGARVDVAWTWVKEIRKPKGMAPGAVLVGSEKVLYVEVDRAALDALARVLDQTTTG